MVRVRTVHGWHEHTSPLSETTMTPADFPLPLLAPEVVAFVGCEAVKLRLPVLRYCVTRTHTALQHRESGTGSWRMLRDRVLGGVVDVDHLSPVSGEGRGEWGREASREGRVGRVPASASPAGSSARGPPSPSYAQP